MPAAPIPAHPTHQQRTNAPHAMNSNRQSVPATATARKSISLLQLLALIAFGGIAASLVLQHFA